MRGQILVPDEDYEIVEDRMAPLGGRVAVFDHIKVTTSERIETERDKSGKVLAVRIVPARGPDVSAPSPSVVKSSQSLGGHANRSEGTRHNRGRAPRP